MNNFNVPNKRKLNIILQQQKQISLLKQELQLKNKEIHELKTELSVKTEQQNHLLQNKFGNNAEFISQQTNKNGKSRYWNSDEHTKFLEALKIYGAKDVKSIAAYVGSRNATQVRSHAQKYFLRLQRENERDSVTDENPSDLHEDDDKKNSKVSNVTKKLSESKTYPNESKMTSKKVLHSFAQESVAYSSPEPRNILPKPINNFSVSSQSSFYNHSPFINAAPINPYFPQNSKRKMMESSESHTFLETFSQNEIQLCYRGLNMYSQHTPKRQSELIQEEFLPRRSSGVIFKLIQELKEESKESSEFSNQFQTESYSEKHNITNNGKDNTLLPFNIPLNNNNGKLPPLPPGPPM